MSLSSAATCKGVEYFLVGEELFRTGMRGINLLQSLTHVLEVIGSVSPAI